MDYSPIVVSRYRVAQLSETIFAKWEVPEILRKLADKGFIKFVEQGLAVGEYDNTVSLYCMPTSAGADFTRILKIANQYVSDSRIKGLAIQARDALIELSEKIPTTYINRDFVLLYRICYEVVMQEPFRNFTVAEKGKMKFMVNTYEQEDLINMIIHFISSSELYCRDTAPSMGLFLYNKDTVHLRVKKGARKSFKKYTEDSFKGS